MEFNRAASQNSMSWKQTYMAAVFEVDKSRILERIEEAEAAVVVRTRALFQSSEDHHQERNALEAALCALRALRSVSEHTTSLAGGKEKLAS